MMILFTLNVTPVVVQPFPFSSCIHIAEFSCIVSRKESIKKRKLKQLNQNTKPSLPFPKSKPTPLLLTTNSNNHPPQTKTKSQALEAVISEIDTSLKNGIKIYDTQLFASLLETCYRLQAYSLVSRIHSLIPVKLVRENMGISSKLIRLYSSNGLVEEAHHLFDQMPERSASAFPWNSLIGGYADMGLYGDALALYFQMVEEDVEPDQHTFPRVLKACSGIGLIHVGEELHRHVIRYGFMDDVFVLNALVDMFAKCGDIVKARKVFNQIKHKDLVTWNSMLIGYIRHDLQADALFTFTRMVQEGLQPDSVTLSALLSGLSSLKIGTQIHGWILQHGLEQNLSVTNALIRFYSSHDKLKQGQWLFEQMPERDVVSWNSIISAHSKDAKALVYFRRMSSAANVLPDAITFVSLLSTCAHLGMVDDGDMLWMVMKDKYKIKPIMEHYACMVNLYARAGLIDKAYDLIIKNMDIDPSPTLWGALLNGCYLHGDADIGEIVARTLFELEPDNEQNFVLLMKIYCSVNRMDDAQRVKTMMVERGLDV